MAMLAASGVGIIFMPIIGVALGGAAAAVNAAFNAMLYNDPEKFDRETLQNFNWGNFRRDFRANFYGGSAEVGIGMVGGIVGGAIGGPLGGAAGWFIGAIIGAGVGQAITNVASDRPWDEFLLGSMLISGVFEGVAGAIGHVGGDFIGDKLSGRPMRGGDKNGGTRPGVEPSNTSRGKKGPDGLGLLERYKRNQWKQAGYDVDNPHIQRLIQERGRYPDGGLGLLERYKADWNDLEWQVLQEMYKGTRFSRKIAHEIRTNRIKMFLTEHDDFVAIASLWKVKDSHNTSAFRALGGEDMIVDIRDGNIKEIAASVVHEGAHITDPRGLSTVFEREMRAWALEAEFAASRNISGNQALEAWQTGGKRELENVIRRGYDDLDEIIEDVNAYTRGASSDFERTSLSGKNIVEESRSVGPRFGASGNAYSTKSMEPHYVTQDPARGVTYFRTEAERAAKEVFVENGKLVDAAGNLVDTTNTSTTTIGGTTIFVMDPNGRIFLDEFRFNRIHHSTFLAGGDVAAAGEIVVVNGELLSVNAQTGHYQINDIMSNTQLEAELQARGMDTSGITFAPY
jgi:hypothetical protein